MEIFFNELSIKPEATSIDEARGKLTTLLQTMQSLRKCDINIMRAHDFFYAERIGPDYIISNFLDDENVSRDTKLLLRTIVRNPCIYDFESYEAEVFVRNKFTTKDIEGNYVLPEGIAVAYVFNSPTISLAGNEHWEKETIALNITPESGESYNKDIVNLSSLESVGSVVFQYWLKSLTPEIPLNSAVNISKVFSSDLFLFDNRAIDDIISWYYDDDRYQTRIMELIFDIVENPFVGGKGLTETLGGGKASKRIVKKDRIVYTYTKEKITIHQCKGHYDDK